MRKIIDMAGMVIGKLTVIKRVDAPTNVKDKQKVYWLCECECGKKKVICGKSLRGKNPTKSCGCDRINKITTHNMTHTRFYNIWLGIKNRCNYSNATHYENYGGRGIKICDEWNNDFMNFYNDMYKSYEEHCKRYDENNTSIDRVNVNGNYEPNNCRWTTRFEQNRNKSNTKKFKAISPSGDIFYSNCQRDFAKEHNLLSSNINHCLKGEYKTHRGWQFYYVIHEKPL